MKTKMPVLFVGHGSPLNAIRENDYTRAVLEMGQTLPQPEAILMVSAHWMTRGSFVTHMPHPKTIHDFSGFPKELFSIQYPAPGSPFLAEMISKQITVPNITLEDSQWGLDHGSWSVLRHLFPKADVPVVQLSLDMRQGAEFHLKLGEQLSFLREESVLIIGSGNVVHNLSAINWDENATPHDWAVEFDEWVKKGIQEQQFIRLAKEVTATNSARLSNPTLEHYYPLLYALGASKSPSHIRFFYEGIHHASLSMRSVILA